MFAILIILFILECGAFCYLFYKILEINKDIDILYKNYSEVIVKITKENISKRRNVLKWFYLLFLKY